MGDRSTIDRVTTIGTDRHPPSIRSFGTYSETMDCAGGENHSSYMGTGRVLSFGKR